MSRFLSMYKYWKNGAIDTKYKRNDNWKKLINNISILNIINYIKNKNIILYYNFK